MLSRLFRFLHPQQSARPERRKRRVAPESHEMLESRILLSAGNLIENGSFEDLGGQSLNRGSWGTFSEIPGWKAVDVVDYGPIEVLRDNTGGTPAADGRMKVELNSHGRNANSRIYQDVNTDPALRYDLTFSYVPRINNMTDTDDVQVWWGDRMLETLTPVKTDGGWTNFSYNVAARSKWTRLEFRAVGDDDTLGGFIDNVQLTTAGLNTRSRHVTVVGGSGDPADWNDVYIQGRKLNDNLFDVASAGNNVVFVSGSSADTSGVGVGPDDVRGVESDGSRFPEIDFNGATGESEELRIHFNQKVDRAEVTVSRFYASESGGNTETGVWTAFDGFGQVVATGDFSATTPIGSGVPGLQTFAIEPGTQFELIELAAGPYLEAADKASDNSDFLVHSIAFADFDDCGCDETDNMIVNGSFEWNAVSVLNRGSWGLYDVIPGWIANTPELTSPMELQRRGQAEHGRMHLELNSHNFEGEPSANASVYQDVATMNGQQYELTFQYRPRVNGNSDTDNILVTWNGAVLDELTAADAPNGWREFTYVVEGGAGSTSRLELSATGRDETLGGYIDTISLTCTGVQPGVHRLHNHPDGNAANPQYGLRLDGLTTGNTNDIFTFDFDHPDAAMFLEYDGVADTIRIYGTAFGGIDTGSDYAPATAGLWAIDFTYEQTVFVLSGDDDLRTDQSPANTGSITQLFGDENTYYLQDFSGNKGFSFQLGDTGNDNGHRGHAGISGWGWLNHADNPDFVNIVTVDVGGSGAAAGWAGVELTGKAIADTEFHSAAVRYDIAVRGISGVGITGAGSRLREIDAVGTDSEQLKVDFQRLVTNATVDVGLLFNPERGQAEVGRWTALDEDGAVVGSGIFAAPNTNILSDPSNAGLMTIAINPGVEFSSIVLDALPYNNGPANNGDSSDYILLAVSYTYEEPVQHFYASDWLFTMEREILCECDPAELWKKRDDIIGTRRDDQLVGTNRSDTIFGRNGADEIFGGRGNDSIHGGNGSDFLNGNRGNDYLSGGRGSDEIHGGRGNDIAWGGSGHDVILGGRGNDILNGDGGNDIIIGGRGQDYIKGGNGSDNLSGGLGNDEIHGGRGRDLIAGGRGNDEITGGRGDDIVNGGRGNDRLSGDDGRDTINGGRGNDLLLGGRGQDELHGGWGRDELNGGRGNDILNGGRGQDILIGGAGRDIVVVGRRSGRDTMLDFRDGADRIDVSGLGIIVSEFSSSWISPVGPDALVRVPRGGSVLLKNVAVTDLDETDFIFASSLFLSGTDSSGSSLFDNDDDWISGL